jgi:exonuclease SbcD
MTRFRDRTGQLFQFVLAPYPFSSRYDLSALEYRSREEENQLLHARVVEWLQAKSVHINPAWPTVLMAHLNVRGSTAHRLYKLNERDDVLFSVAELNPMWSYIALGHIHFPQKLGDAEHIQYAGSLDRLDFGETHQDHGVTLVELNASQPAVCHRLPLPPTPFYTIELDDPATEMEALSARYPDAAQAIVRFRIHPPAGNVSREEIARRLKKQFPRWYELQWTDVGPASFEATPPRFDQNKGMEERVRDYLESELGAHPYRDELLRLAHQLLDEVRNT